MSASAYERVQKARGKDRPTGVQYIRHLLTDFMELHGDRRFADDGAVVAGLACLRNLPVTVVAIEKGSTTRERVAHNFGAPNPEGYRKALRLMKQAEKFHRPVICFVDTSGAFCGIGAEERGQGQAIAENLMEMMTLKTPVISILIGEGGSGGALGLAVADRVWMLENAIYSVISPEGCASILWKDSAKRPRPRSASASPPTTPMPWAWWSRSFPSTAGTGSASARAGGGPLRPALRAARPPPGGAHRPAVLALSRHRRAGTAGGGF